LGKTVFEFKFHEWEGLSAVEAGSVEL